MPLFFGVFMKAKKAIIRELLTRRDEVYKSLNRIDNDMFLEVELESTFKTLDDLISWIKESEEKQWQLD